MSQLSEELILDKLKQIIDPDLRKDIVTLGFIRDLAIEGGDVSFRIVLTTPACPVKEEMETQAREIVGGLPGVTNVNVTMDAEVPQGRGIANNVTIEGVKNIIAVSSGKGGVGKSTVAVNLAVALAGQGAKVGIMDADVYGPNIPMMLGTGYDQPEVRNQKLIPIEAHGVKMISMAVLVPRDKPMILRGPMLHGVVRQQSRRRRRSGAGERDVRIGLDLDLGAQRHPAPWHDEALADVAERVDVFIGPHLRRESPRFTDQPLQRIAARTQHRHHGAVVLRFRHDLATGLQAHWTYPE